MGIMSLFRPKNPSSHKREDILHKSQEKRGTLTVGERERRKGIYKSYVQSYKKEGKEAFDKSMKQQGKGTLSYGIGRSFQNVANTRAQMLNYGQQLKRPMVGGTSKGKKGRPAGASGKYVIPGYGPVGVYEYRKWFNAQMRIKKAEAFARLREAQTQARQSGQSPSPYPTGPVPARPETYHQEIDRIANEFP